MPTVYRFDGFRVFIHTNDHRPPHVHVTKGSGEALFYLNCPNGPTELRENYRRCFSRSDIAEIQAALDPIVPVLCEKWSEIHGP
jgi:hypothetical protein